MKDFFKFFFASILALVVMSILPFIIFVGIIASIGSAGDKVVAVPANSILVIDLSTSIADKVSDNPMDYLDFKDMKMNIPLLTQKAVQAIYAAAGDDRIKSIVIDARKMCVVPLTTLQELRRAIKVFQASDKKVYAYSTMYDNSSYFISSLADEVVLAPMGSFLALGLSSDIIYYKGLFDKIGVGVNLLRVGKYKSAGESFVEKSMSKANRDQVSSMLNSMWGSMVADITESRNITAADFNDMLNQLSAFDAKGALENKVIDKIMYTDEFDEMINPGSTSKYISLGKYASTQLSLRSIGENGKPVIMSKNRIALLNAVGTIVEGNGGDGEVGDFSLCQKIRNLRADSSVKAVVLRVNSPGGSALASEYIWRELTLLQKEKPLIVSMGRYAASGGYYIAAPADFIFAEEATLTGSIGVFSMIFNVKELMGDFGLQVNSVSTNNNTGLSGSAIYNGLNRVETRAMQSSVNSVYDVFINRVAQGRNLSPERVEELAQGRVWTGLQAMENGLVDQIGGVIDAVHLAATRAGVLDDYILVEQSMTSNPFSLVLDMMAAKIETFGQPNFGIFQNQFDFVTSLQKGGEVKAVMPYLLDIK